MVTLNFGFLGKISLVVVLCVLLSACNTNNHSCETVTQNVSGTTKLGECKHEQMVFDQV
jgi:hypothetical protein